MILFLLQSCSGGRIGNFLELSFSNIKEDELKSIENNFKSEKVLINNKNLKNMTIEQLSSIISLMTDNRALGYMMFEQKEKKNFVTS